MSSATVLPILADFVQALHFAFVLFVVGGLVLVVVGNLNCWKWVNGIHLRAAHLASISFVFVESWLDMPCPLTSLESWLRPETGEDHLSQGFIAYWVQRVFAYQIQPWVYKVTDSAFWLLTVVAWWRFPPHRRRTVESN